MSLLLVMLGIIIGVPLGWFAANYRSVTTQQTMAQSQGVIAAAVAPLHEALARYESRVNELERNRVGTYESLREQLRSVSQVSGELRTETQHLVAALRAPQVRGRWGEHQLRRVVEAAGMLEHCDFTEQVTAASAPRNSDGASRVVRPDMVVHLHGGRQVVVDSKAPLEAYLAALEARDDHSRTEHLRRHAKHLRAHVVDLAAKSYWASFEPSPEFVVLFVPADPFLDVALQHDPSLMEEAFARNVVLATPATLVALLRTVAYTWRQDSLARNALEVQKLAKELYSRLSTMGDHLARVGSSLNTAVSSYNKAVGSLESRVLVSARKMAELGVSDRAMAGPEQVESISRQLQSPELTQPDAAAATLAEARNVGSPPR
jgi:DNA recombination protein RmuC